MTEIRQYYRESALTIILLECFHNFQELIICNIFCGELHGDLASPRVDPGIRDVEPV